MRQPAHKKNQAQIVLGLVTLGLLISLILLGKILDGVGVFLRPFSPETPSERRYSWDGQGALNVVVKADQVYVLSLNLPQNQAVILKIPDNTHVSLPFGFGKWATGSIYQLGQSETPRIGARLLKEAIGEALGVPVDGYIILHGSKLETPFEKTVLELRQNPLLALSFLGQIKTDLSLWEYWQMIWGLRGIRFDKIKTLDLGQSSLTLWSLLADGSRVLTFDQQRLDQFVQKYFENSKVKDEGLNIGIYNSTNHLGLAEKASRVVTNLGGRVTFTANLSQALKTTYVLGKNSYTLTLLSKIFVPKESSKPSDLDLSRAEINLFLGEDWFLRYNSP